MCRTSVERRVVKVSSIAGEVPTIPASDDHTDGSWIATDVYVGEMFFNSADGIMYVRDANGITVQTPNAVPGGNVKRYVANFTQTGTSAPTVDILENTIGNIVWTRFVAGNYKGTLTGAFPSANKVACGGQSTSYGSAGNSIVIPYWLNANVIQVDSGALATGLSGDDLMTSCLVTIEVYP